MDKPLTEEEIVLPELSSLPEITKIEEGDLFSGQEQEWIYVWGNYSSEVSINPSTIENYIIYSDKRGESSDGKCSMIIMEIQEDSVFWNSTDLEMLGRQSKNGITLLIWDITCALNTRITWGEEWIGIEGIEGTSILIIKESLGIMWIIGDSIMEKIIIIKMLWEMWIIMSTEIGEDIIIIR